MHHRSSWKLISRKITHENLLTVAKNIFCSKKSRFEPSADSSQSLIKAHCSPRNQRLTSIHPHPHARTHTHSNSSFTPSLCTSLFSPLFKNRKVHKMPPTMYSHHPNFKENRRLRGVERLEELNGFHESIHLIESRGGTKKRLSDCPMNQRYCHPNPSSGPGVNEVSTDRGLKDLAYIPQRNPSLERPWVYGFPVPRVFFAAPTFMTALDPSTPPPPRNRSSTSTSQPLRQKPPQKLASPL